MKIQLSAIFLCACVVLSSVRGASGADTYLSPSSAASGADSGADIMSTSANGAGSGKDWGGVALAPPTTAEDVGSVLAQGCTGSGITGGDSSSSGSSGGSGAGTQLAVSSDCSIFQLMADSAFGPGSDAATGLKKYITAGSIDAGGLATSLKSAVLAQAAHPEAKNVDTDMQKLRDVYAKWGQKIMAGNAATMKTADLLDKQYVKTYGKIYDYRYPSKHPWNKPAYDELNKKGFDYYKTRDAYYKDIESMNAEKNAVFAQMLASGDATKVKYATEAKQQQDDSLAAIRNYLKKQQQIAALAFDKTVADAGVKEIQAQIAKAKTPEQKASAQQRLAVWQARSERDTKDHDRIVTELTQDIADAKAKGNSTAGILGGLESEINLNYWREHNQAQANTSTGANNAVGISDGTAASSVVDVTPSMITGTGGNTPVTAASGTPTTAAKVTPQ